MGIIFFNIIGSLKNKYKLANIDFHLIAYPLALFLSNTKGEAFLPLVKAIRREFVYKVI